MEPGCWNIPRGFGMGPTLLEGFECGLGMVPTEGKHQLYSVAMQSHEEKLKQGHF